MNKWLPLLLAVTVGAVAPAALAEQKSKAEKARAAFAFMDRQEFMDGIEEAEGCTARDDFACADRALQRVEELISNAEDRELWYATSSAVSAARERLAAAEEAERQRRDAEFEANRRERDRDSYAQPSGADRFAQVMGALSSAYADTMADYQRQQAQTRALNARIEAAQEATRRRNEAEAAARQAEFRQREAERQLAYANQLAAAQQQAAAQQVAREAAAAKRQADAAALQAKQALEREKRIAQQEAEARANAQRQMASFVASTREAEARNRPAPSANGFAGNDYASRSGARSGSAGGTSGSANVSDFGPAKAWCRQSKEDVFECYGPSQFITGMGAISYGTNRLQTALQLSGCANGSGYTPKVGMGGESFDCGRRLKKGEYWMPLYDPFRGGQRPVKVRPEACDGSEAVIDVRCN